MRLLFLLIVSDGGVFMVVPDGGVFIFSGVLGLLHRFGKSLVRKGLPIPVIISWKHFHFIQKPIGCRLHASSWWPDSITHMWTVSNVWRKLKHLAFTCILLWHLYWRIIIGSHCPRCRHLGFSHNAIGPAHLTTFATFWHLSYLENVHKE